jgi:general secretion pathway protein G
MAVPNSSGSAQRSREAILRQDLSTLRSLISQYTIDHNKAPQSLADLVTAGYLKQIPKDPITNESDWRLSRKQKARSADEQDQGGIDDVHSSSTAVGTDGTAYNTW